MTAIISSFRSRPLIGAGFFFLVLQGFLMAGSEPDTARSNAPGAHRVDSATIKEDLPGLVMKGQAFTYRILVDVPEPEGWILEITNQGWLGSFKVRSTGELRGQITRSGVRMGEVQIQFELEGTMWGLQEIPWPLLRLQDAGGRGGEDLPIPARRPRVLVVPQGALSGLTALLGITALVVYASNQRRKRRVREAEEAEARERERRARRRLLGSPGRRVGPD